MNVLKEAHSSIPLTIAGKFKFIPENLGVLEKKKRPSSMIRSHSFKQRKNTIPLSLIQHE